MKNTFNEHLRKENEEKLIDAWKYLKPWQKASLFLRAKWWSLPSLNAIIKRIQQRVIKRITYQLYPAHWIGTTPLSSRSIPLGQRERG